MIDCAFKTLSWKSWLKLCLAFVPAILFGATINVPADYASIQAAIGAASNGDTIVVAAGTYFENLNFQGKAITVKSAAGPAATIIDGRNADSVVRFGTKETATSVLQGFTVQNGTASFNNSYLGGGVSIAGSSPTITGNIITLNHGSNGAGLSIQGGAPTIQGNTITGNLGEGIYVLGSSGGAGPQITGNVISNNTSGYFGAGIDLFGSGPVLIQNNLITGNKGSEGGGIGMVNGSNPTIIQNVIVGNTGSTGGGFYSLTPVGATAYLLNNTIAGNSSPKGSAVYIDGNDAGVQLVNNILTASPGQGAVYCGNFNTTSTPLISFNDVIGAPGRNYEGLCSDLTGHSGNISADPLFDCPGGNNYRLAPGSPAIDAGNTAAASLPKTDYDGSPRVVDGTGSGTSKVDLGAYEFQGPGALSISPTALVFGNQLVGTASMPQAISVQNTGTQTAWFCGFNVSSDFSQSNTCSDHVNSGASCNINVTFTPATQGAKSSVLGINANTTSPLQVNISGTAVNPAPVLSSVSPASAATAGPSFTLTVSGSGFVSNSTVLWNGSSRPTTFSSATQLTAAISTQDIAQPGIVQITVANPAPGGGTSTAGTFSISNAAISSGGLLNAGSYTQAITPGELVAVFGTNLSSSTAPAQRLPLPTTLANSSVYLNNYSSPLLYVSPGQINFQVPWELSGLTSASLTVVTNGIASNPVAVNLSGAAPAMLSTNQQGSGQGAILLAGTATVADAAHPVNRTDTISIFCLGLGPVTGTVLSGAASPFNPPLSTQSLPTVTIGGVPGSVLFSGLAPGFAGVYQVNVRLPLNAPTGPAVPVVLQIGDISSNTVTIGVQ